MVPLSDAIGFFTIVPPQTAIPPQLSQVTKEDKQAAWERSRDGLTFR